MDVNDHVQILKSLFQKKKDIDINNHVNDWVALLHYQSHNGDGLYAPLEQMQQWVDIEISEYINSLSQDQLKELTQDAYERSHRLIQMNFW